MAKLVITRGLPASGKSTAVEEAVRAAVAANMMAVRAGRDFLRDQLFGTRLNLTQAQENVVSLAEKAQVETFLKAGIDVYVDAMHLRNKYVRDWAKLASRLGAEFVVWDEFLSVPLEECIERDAQRTGDAYLGADVIRGIHKRFFPLPKLDLSDIKPVKIEPYVPNLELPEAYMVDIDGTCTTGPCDRSPYEWSKVGQDLPNEAVILTVSALFDAGYNIIFCSGRDAVCRPETEEWLKNSFWKSVLSGRNKLFMREQGDMRKDSIVKLELFDKHVRNKYNVVGVYDDRPQVIRMWKELGLQVFDVAQSEEF